MPHAGASALMFNADGLAVGDSLYLGDGGAFKDIDLMGARVGGNVGLDGVRVVAPGTISVSSWRTPSFRHMPSYGCPTDSRQEARRLPGRILRSREGDGHEDRPMRGRRRNGSL